MDYYQSLVEQQKETKLQIDQFNKDYQTFEKGSDEAIAILATITMLRVDYAINQKKITDILSHWISYQRGTITPPK